MDHSFARLTSSWICWLLLMSSLMGQPPTPASDVPERTDRLHGADLLRQVVMRIHDHETVAAKVRHRANLFDQKLVGSGIYRQRSTPQGTQVRFSLSVKTGERTVNLLHIGDGRFLWMHDNLDGRPKLSRVDLQRLRRAEAEQGGVPSLSFSGGLPQLLTSLQDNFLVSAPQAVVFQEVPMWAIACTWNPERLARLWPAVADHLDEQGRLRTEQFPEQLPDRVFVLVGQDDLFPYHIDFRRSPSQGGLNVLGESGASVSRSLATMEFFEVQFGAPLDPMLFVYKPSNIEVVDRTDEYLVRIQSAAIR